MVQQHRGAWRLRAITMPAAFVAGLSLAACSGDASFGTAPIDSPAPGPVNPPASSPIANPLSGATFHVDGSSQARRTADSWRNTRPADAAQLDKVAAQPHVRWLGNWNSEVRRDVTDLVATMSAGGATPVFVVYNIPKRDCGGMSGNNTTTVSAYRSWITELAAGLGSHRAAVILEPDALAGMSCLSAAEQDERLELLNLAVRALRASGSVSVYIDAGNPGWESTTTMASRLTRAGVALTQGFALNVSNFISTAENISYGTQLSGMIGGKHFVIDTGRNGNGAAPDLQWCNPAGRALGPRPTSQTGSALVDAYLWVKAPGESDGACGGAAASGSWMAEYALGLAQRAGY